MKKKSIGKKPKAPKGCKITSCGHTKTEAKKIADNKRKAGYKARVIAQVVDGKKKHCVATCGKRKKSK